MFVMCARNVAAHFKTNRENLYGLK